MGLIGNLIEAVIMVSLCAAIFNVILGLSHVAGLLLARAKS